MTITEQRTKQVLFSVPYSEATTTRLVRKSETRFKKPEDLVGKVVAAQLNPGHHFAAKQMDERLQKEKGAGLKNIRTYTTPGRSLSRPRDQPGGCGGHVCADHLGPLKEKPGVYEIGFPIAERLYHGWAFRKEDVDLQRAVNSIFIELKRTGTIAELQMKWFGFTVETPNEGFEPAKF